jgi:hypothetical protein
MNCNNKLYIPLFLLLIFILIVINHTCKYSYKPRVESFRNNNTFGHNDKNSKYLFACVDKNGNLNQYYVPDDGSMWSNAVYFAETGQNKPSYVLASEENSGWGENDPPDYRVPGINCENDNNSIFKNISLNSNGNINDANSFGGGTNSKQAVMNLQPSDITAENFANNNCTKERWYLFKHQGTERKYIYAVFKRKPWINNVDCCKNDSNVQRNGCEAGYENKNGSNCNDFMKQYCNTNNNITNGICRSWCLDSKNSDTCNNFKYDFCNAENNFQNNFDFCKTNCKNQKCDAGAARYCGANLNNSDYCACFSANAMRATSADIISALDDANARSDPICFSSKCKNEFAYQTQTMKDSIQGCPQCLQKMTLTNLTRAEDIKQSCNVNTQSSNTQNTPKTPTPNPTPSTPNPTPSTPTPTPIPTKPRTMSDYLDSISNFLNSIIDSISNLFNN